MRGHFLLAVLFVLVHATLAGAGASLPTADLAGSADHDLVGRFAGSFIVSAATASFAEVSLPLSPLKAVRDRRDSRNNILFQPEQARTVEGRRTRLVYVTPAEASPLEVIRNYQRDLEAKGASLRYQCAGMDCGGAADRSSSGGGGDMSLAMYLWPQESVRDPHGTAGYCAQMERLGDQRFALMELADRGAWVAVHTYRLRGGSSCQALNDRTVAVVDIVEAGQLEEKMVVIRAEEMAESIAASGSIALYGISFDFNKAEVRPESAETLAQIVRLLEADSGLRLLVVGHTDNAGSYAFNLDLSTRRARAVVQALVSGHKVAPQRLTPVGVSYACPVAPNDSEAGRARNRRVELVKM